jgi:hypothetical protein
VSLELILARIADGSLAASENCGFTVVDAAPWGTVAEPPRPSSEPPPPTYVAIPAGNVPFALSFEQFLTEEVPAPVAPVIEPVDQVDPELPLLDDEEDDKPIGNWREVRSRTGRIRRPPLRVAPLAA